MILINTDHAADWHNDGNEVILPATGVTHHGFGGPMTVIAQTYISFYSETEDQAWVQPFIVSFTSSTQGHKNIASKGFVIDVIDHCTQVTYSMNVANCEVLAICQTMSVF